MNVIKLLIILLLVVIIACCIINLLPSKISGTFGNSEISGSSGNSEKCETCGGISGSCEICRGGCDTCTGGDCHACTDVTNITSITGNAEKRNRKRSKKGKDEENKENSELSEEARQIIKSGDSTAVATYLGKFCSKGDSNLASEVLALRHDIINIISHAPGLVDYVYNLPHAENKDVENVMTCIRDSLPKNGGNSGGNEETLKDIYGALRLYIAEVGTNAPIEKFLTDKFGKPTKLDMPIDTKGVKHKNLYALINKIINEKNINNIADFVKHTEISYENFLPKNKIASYQLSDDLDIDILTDLTLEIKSKVGSKATLQEVNGLLRKINPSMPMYKFAPGYAKKSKAVIKKAKERAFRVDTLGYTPLIEAITDSIKYGQVNKIFEVLVNGRIIPTINQEREIRLYLSNLGKLLPQEEKISLFIDKNYYVIQKYRQEIEELKKRIAMADESAKSNKLLEKLDKVEKLLEDKKTDKVEAELSKVADAAHTALDLPLTETPKIPETPETPETPIPPVSPESDSDSDSESDSNSESELGSESITEEEIRSNEEEIRKLEDQARIAKDEYIRQQEEERVRQEEFARNLTPTAPPMGGAQEKKVKKVTWS